jgi:hypothetical protein
VERAGKRPQQDVRIPVVNGLWNRRRNHPTPVTVRPFRKEGRGPQLRGIVAAGVATHQLFELLAVDTRVAEL